MHRFAILLLLVWAAAAAPPPRIDSSKLVDLTWDYDEQTVYWPTARTFRFEKESWGITPAGYWYSAGRYSASEHGGTHIDAPIHFAEGQASTDQIPVAKLVLPAILIDVSSRCANNPDFLLTAGYIAGWEKARGKIPEGSILLVRTGWGRFWPDKKRYLGDTKPGLTTHLHFPGIGKDAADLLVKRGIAAVGIDTASIDYGQSKDFMTHRVLYAAGIYGLENMAHLEKVPVKGATIIALPMKIKGGSGGPVRIVALLP